jgi:carboxypeptidase T
MSLRNATVALLCAGSALAQPLRVSPPEPLMLVRLCWSDSLPWQLLWDAGADEHSLRLGSHCLTAVLPAFGVAQLQQSGLRLDTLIADLAAFYRERIRRAALPTPTADDPANFRLGTLGGFYRLHEIFEEFDRMRRFLPEAVSEPEIIGYSVEGRPIYGYRFTLAANPDTVPAALYTALHHAREPGGVTTLVYFLWWLLEGARRGDPEALFLLRNRLLYVVPVVNPDGYAYNEETAPEGGGMWRKNRRPNPDGSYGVDLNRNYGPPHFWDSPNRGSSTNPRSDTYRGTAPFSEPETQAIRDLCLSLPFHTALNYHTYGEFLIYPYAALPQETPDSLLYRLLCAEASRPSLYSFGRDRETVGYAVRGASDDWMYDTSDGKPKTLAMTVEVGSLLDGFWPEPERILPHARENLWLNRQIAWSAGANLRPFRWELQWEPSPTLRLELCNLGAQTAPAGAAVRIVSLDSLVQVSNSPLQLPELPPAQCTVGTWSLHYAPERPNGAPLRLELQLEQDGVLRRDTLSLWGGRPVVHTLFEQPADSVYWDLRDWALAYDSTVGRWALTDSPDGAYPDSATLVLQQRQPVTIAPRSTAVLEFWIRWSVEARFDFAVVEFSTDGGARWQPVRTERMRPASGIAPSRQESGYGFDGNFPLWIPQRAVLAGVAGKPLLLRFRLLSDASGSFDGVWLTRIRIWEFGDTTLPVLEAAEKPMPRLLPHPLRRGEYATLELGEPESSTVLLELVSVHGVRIWQALVHGAEGFASFRLPHELAPGFYQLRLRTGLRSWSLPCIVL